MAVSDDRPRPDAAHERNEDPAARGAGHGDSLTSNGTHECVDFQVSIRNRWHVEGELQRIAGANIRAYRRARGVSQEELADVLGVHRTYMGGVERGERNLTLRSLERLAERMGVDPVTLLTPPTS